MKKTAKDFIVILACLVAPFVFIGILYLAQYSFEEITEAREIEALRSQVPDLEKDSPDVLDMLERQDFPVLDQALLSTGNDPMIGNAISVYEYLPDGFQRLCYIYPLFCGDEILAAARISSPNYFFAEQYIDDHLTSQISRTIAVVYDYDTCYAYDGTEFQVLYEFDPHHTEYRGNIEDTADLSAFTAELVLSEVAPVAVLEYEP